MRKGELSAAVAMLQSLLFFAYGGFPVLYLEQDWPAVHVSTALRLGGGMALVVGMASLLTGMIRLGIARSMGRGSPQLETAGLYRISRNPQAVACGLYVLGFFLMWPSWFAAGWALLYLPLIHRMVLCEEAHLARLHGQAYREYCARVPRYLGGSPFAVSA
jgi:protein-S-isoprenylcysteine O-methyltransferase Ste14